MKSDQFGTTNSKSNSFFFSFMVSIFISNNYFMDVKLHSDHAELRANTSSFVSTLCFNLLVKFFWTKNFYKFF